MSKKFSDADLASIQELSDHLGRSSKMAVPIFFFGVLATIVGAGIAIYYIFDLSNRLEQTQIDLKRTEAVLEDTRRGLEQAQTALQSVDQADEGEGSEIQAAISEVSKSQRDLTAASTAITRASTRLPTQSTKSVTQQQSEGGLSGLWVDGYGTSYRIIQNGNNFSYSAEFVASPGAIPTTGSARGTIDGRTARYRYSDSTGRKLECTANVAADYKSMQERCTDPGSKEGEGEAVTLVRT